MARPFLTDDAKRALTGAVQAVETASSAELVIAVRPRSGPYLHADLLAGIAAAVMALAVLLFSPWPFALGWFVFDPLLAGILVGFLSSRSPELRRRLTSARGRRERVSTAARAVFVERRVHGTAGRTGMLLYVSLLEREIEVVSDIGVEAASEGFRGAVEAIREVVRQGGDGVETAAAVAALGPVLAPVLGRNAEDVDELPNEVCE